MATATERKVVVGMTETERLREVRISIELALDALKGGDIRTMQKMLLKAYTLGSQL